MVAVRVARRAPSGDRNQLACWAKHAGNTLSLAFALQGRNGRRPDGEGSQVDEDRVSHHVCATQGTHVDPVGDSGDPGGRAAGSITTTTRTVGGCSGAVTLRGTCPTVWIRRAVGAGAHRSGGARAVAPCRSTDLRGGGHRHRRGDRARGRRPVRASTSRSIDRQTHDGAAMTFPVRRRKEVSQ